MSRLDDRITEYAKSCFGDISIEKDEEFKQDIKDLMLELIGETNSFVSDNTGRVWIDPDHLIQKVSEL